MKEKYNRKKILRKIFFHGISSAFYLAMFTTFVKNKYVILVERMITTWYLALHMIFVLSRLFEDIISLLLPQYEKLNHVIKKINNVLFISLIFPYAIFIPSIYWILFYYNSNLIHPNFLEVSLPSWVSVSSHSVIALVAFVEMLTTNYDYEGSIRGAITLLLTFTVSYASCLIGTYIQYGFWLYPVFHLFSSTILFIIFPTLMVLVLWMFFAGKLFAKVFHEKKSSIPKTERTIPELEKESSNEKTEFSRKGKTTNDKNTKDIVSEEKPRIVKNDNLSLKVENSPQENVEPVKKEKSIENADYSEEKISPITFEEDPIQNEVLLDKNTEFFVPENNISFMNTKHLTQDGNESKFNEVPHSTTMSYFTLKEDFSGSSKKKETFYQSYEFLVGNKVTDQIMNHSESQMIDVGENLEKTDSSSIEKMKESSEVPQEMSQTNGKESKISNQTVSENDFTKIVDVSVSPFRKNLSHSEGKSAIGTCSSVGETAVERHKQADKLKEKLYEKFRFGLKCLSGCSSEESKGIKKHYDLLMRFSGTTSDIENCKPREEINEDKPPENTPQKKDNSIKDKKLCSTTQKKKRHINESNSNLKITKNSKVPQTTKQRQIFKRFFNFPKYRKKNMAENSSSSQNNLTPGNVVLSIIKDKNGGSIDPQKAENILSTLEVPEAAPGVKRCMFYGALLRK